MNKFNKDRNDVFIFICSTCNSIDMTSSCISHYPTEPADISIERGNLSEFPFKPNVLKLDRAFYHNSIDDDVGLLMSNKSNSKTSVVNI